MFTVLEVVQVALILLGGFWLIALIAKGRPLNGIVVLTIVVIAMLMATGFVGVYTKTKVHSREKSAVAEAMNPPVMMTCVDGVHDCTLTVVVPVKGSGSMQICPEGNYDTMLSGVREEHSIKVFFSCDPNLVHLVHQAWEYEENDLALPDGQPVELAEVKHVQAVSPVFLVESVLVGPFDVFDGTKRR